MSRATRTSSCGALAPSPDSPRTANVSSALPAVGAETGHRTSTDPFAGRAILPLRVRRDAHPRRGERRLDVAGREPLRADDDARLHRVPRAQEARERRARHQRPARDDLGLPEAEAVVGRRDHRHEAVGRQAVRELELDVRLAVLPGRERRREVCRRTEVGADRGAPSAAAVRPLVAAGAPVRVDEDAREVLPRLEREDRERPRRGEDGDRVRGPVIGEHEDPLVDGVERHLARDGVPLAVRHADVRVDGVPRAERPLRRLHAHMEAPRLGVHGEGHVPHAVRGDPLVGGEVAAGLGGDGGGVGAPLDDVHGDERVRPEVVGDGEREGGHRPGERAALVEVDPRALERHEGGRLAVRVLDEDRRGVTHLVRAPIRDELHRGGVAHRPAEVLALAEAVERRARRERVLPRVLRRRVDEEVPGVEDGEIARRRGGGRRDVAARDDLVDDRRLVVPARLARRLEHRPPRSPHELEMDPHPLPLHAGRVDSRGFPGRSVSPLWTKTSAGRFRAT